MKTTTDYDRFCEKWNELDSETKIQVLNDYAWEYDPDVAAEYFDEEFFDHFGRDTMAAVRAAVYGEVNFFDPYIRFDGYGNLVSMSTPEAGDWADCFVDDIFDHEDIWTKYFAL